MPQVIIHASSSIRSEDKIQLVGSIRESIPKLLNVAEHIGQVILYESPQENRCTHVTRDHCFVFVEVSMYPGRTAEMKLRFLQNVISLIHHHTGVDTKDINCVIHEIQPENYHGGVSHDYIEQFRNTFEAQEVIIRPFHLSDQKKVVELWIKCGLVVSHNNPVRDIERKLRVNPEWFLVGEIDGDVMATCMAGFEGHRGWINYLAVRPDLQGQGYGKMIMAHAEAVLKAAGCPKINLQIRSTNQRVIGFYESIGYKQDPVVSMGKRLIPDNPCPAEQGSILGYR